MNNIVSSHPLSAGESIPKKRCLGETRNFPVWGCDKNMAGITKNVHFQHFDSEMHFPVI